MAEIPDSQILMTVTKSNGEKVQINFGRIINCGNACLCFDSLLGNYYGIRETYEEVQALLKTAKNLEMVDLPL